MTITIFYNWLVMKSIHTVRTLSKIYALICYTHIYLIRLKFKYNMPYCILFRLYRYFYPLLISLDFLLFKLHSYEWTRIENWFKNRFSYFVLKHFFCWFFFCQNDWMYNQPGIEKSFIITFSTFTLLCITSILVCILSNLSINWAYLKKKHKKAFFKRVLYIYRKCDHMVAFVLHLFYF